MIRNSIYRRYIVESLYLAHRLLNIYISYINGKLLFSSVYWCMIYISFHMTAAKIHTERQYQPISDVWRVCRTFNGAFWLAAKNEIYMFGAPTYATELYRLLLLLAYMCIMIAWVRFELLNCFHVVCFDEYDALLLGNAKDNLCQSNNSAFAAGAASLCYQNMLWIFLCSSWFRWKSSCVCIEENFVINVGRVRFGRIFGWGSWGWGFQIIGIHCRMARSRGKVKIGPIVGLWKSLARW